MPLIKLHVSKSVVDAESVLAALSKTVSEATGKPEQSVMVTCDTGPVMLGGHRVNGAMVEVRGIGGINKETNLKITKAVGRHLKDHLDIDPSHVYLNFMDIDRTNWGWNDKTFG